MNKLTKLLSVFVLAGVIGTGVAGVAGCKKSKGHTHKYTYTVDVEDATKHNGVCDCGKDPIIKEGHVDTKDSDGKCDLCGATIQQQGEEPPAGATVTGVTVTAAGGATEVAKEATLQLSAAVAGTGNPAQTVTWATSDDSKATVSTTGLVTGVAEGTVTITATSTVDTTKKGTINLTVTAKGAVDPGPQPEKTIYETLKEQSNKLYNNEFGEGGTVGVHGGYGVQGIYTDIEGAVAISNGVLKHQEGVKNAKGENSNSAIIIDFGPLSANSTLEGYMELNCSAMGSKWNLVSFRNDTTAVFTLRAPTSGSNFVYSLDNGTTEVATEEAVATAKDTVYKIYYKFDLATGKVTVTVNDKKIVTDLEANITGITGISISSSSSGSRLVTVDNVVYCGEAMALADYKDLKTTALNNAYGAYDSELYSATRYEDIGEAKATGLQEITAATDIAGVSAAYNKAIKAMKAVPTIEGEALYNAKEEYKTSIAEAFPAYEYYVNATAYTTAYDRIIAAIDAYSGEIGSQGETEPTGMYADTAINNAGMALSDIETDMEVVSAAKDAAKTALGSYRSGETFTTNATAFNEAVSTATGAVNNITFTSSSTTVKADVDAVLAAITKAETDGKAAIDAIKSDAQLLAEAKTAALETIANYKTTEVAALAPDESTTQEAIDEVKANITAARATGTQAVNAATTIAQVTAAVNTAKSNIDGYIASLNESLADAKTREKATLLTEYNTAKTGVTNDTLLGILEADYNACVTAIDEVTEESQKATVSTLRETCVTLLNVRVARYNAYVDVVNEANTLKTNLQNEKAKDDIDDAVKYDISDFETESKWSAVMTAIHQAATLTAVGEKKQAAIDAITKISDDAKAASYEVTLGETGETVSIKYGEELKLGDIHVTAYNVTAASYNGTDITAESGVIVYDDITISVTTAEIAGYVGKFSWKAPGSGTVGATLINNSLVTVTPSASSAFVTSSSEVEIDNEKFTTGWQSASVGKSDDNSQKPLVITVNEKVKSLNLYLGLGDASFGRRVGSINVIVKDSAGNVKSNFASEVPEEKEFIKVKHSLSDLEIGDKVNVYISNLAESCRLYLLGIDASIDESKITKTVHVTWKDADDNVIGETKDYYYYETANAPEDPEVAGKVFLYWSKTKNGNEAYTYGQLLGESNLTLYAVYQESDATIKFVGEDGTTELASVPAASGTKFNTDNKPDDPTKADSADGKQYKFVGWATRAEDPDNAGSYIYTVVDLDNYTVVAGDLTLYAYFKELVTQSFLYSTSETAVADKIDKTDAYEVNDTIVSNGVLFDMSAAYKMSALIDSKNNMNLNGSSIGKVYGLGTEAFGSDINLLKITAKDSKIQVTIYMAGGQANASFGTNRVATISAKTADNEAVTLYVGDEEGKTSVTTSDTKRALQPITFIIEAGDTVTITVSPAASKTDGAIYFYGITAEAV